MPQRGQHVALRRARRLRGPACDCRDRPRALDLAGGRTAAAAGRKRGPSAAARGRRWSVVERPPARAGGPRREPDVCVPCSDGPSCPGRAGRAHEPCSFSLMALLSHDTHARKQRIRCTPTAQAQLTLQPCKCTRGVVVRVLAFLLLPDVLYCTYDVNDLYAVLSGLATVDATSSYAPSPDHVIGAPRGHTH